MEYFIIGFLWLASFILQVILVKNSNKKDTITWLDVVMLLLLSPAIWITLLLMRLAKFLGKPVWRKS